MDLTTKVHNMNAKERSQLVVEVVEEYTGKLKMNRDMDIINKYRESKNLDKYLSYSDPNHQDIKDFLVKLCGIVKDGQFTISGYLKQENKEKYDLFHHIVTLNKEHYYLKPGKN